MNPSADTMRFELERAMRRALATFPTNDRHRIRFLVGFLTALLDLDVALVNRFIAQPPPR